jgi:endonuclease YncB( thermonuclease family)
MLRLSLTLILLASSSAAQTVTDGDTIKLNGTTWRLWGVDAPELHQTCKDGWAAGIESKRTLERLIAAGSIRCELKDTDRYGRSVGLCRTGEQDLGAARMRPYPLQASENPKFSTPLRLP